MLNVYAEELGGYYFFCLLRPLYVQNHLLRQHSTSIYISRNHRGLVPTDYSYTNLGPRITPVTLPEDSLSKPWDMRTSSLIENGIYTSHSQGCATSSRCPSSTHYSYPYEWLSTCYCSPAVCPQPWPPCPGPPPGNTFKSGKTLTPLAAR